jgi:hypothetical protein
VIAIAAAIGPTFADSNEPETSSNGSPADQAAGQIKQGAQQIGQGASRLGEGIRQGAVNAWEALKAGAAAAIDKFNGRQTAAEPGGAPR